MNPCSQNVPDVSREIDRAAFIESLFASYIGALETCTTRAVASISGHESKLIEIKKRLDDVKQQIESEKKAIPCLANCFSPQIPEKLADDTACRRAYGLVNQEHEMERRHEEASDHVKLLKSLAAIQAPRFGTNSVFMSRAVLVSCVDRYFVESDQYKELHGIRFTNAAKRAALTANLIARTRPIMIVAKRPSEYHLLINEMFAVFCATSMMEAPPVSGILRRRLLYCLRYEVPSIDSLVAIFEEHASKKPAK